jgi:DNA-binding XRE family transcriptional regulator
MSKLKFVMKPGYISATLKGKSFSFSESHPSFTSIKEALVAKNFRKAESLINNSEVIQNQTYGAITVQRGVINYRGKPVNTTLTKKILQLMQAGESVIHMLKFMDNLYQNPDQEMHKELFTHLENNNHPICDDGTFISYKAVRSDYMDCHSGTISNRLGQVVMFPRSKADASRRNLCSYGLHFASLSYVGGFSGQKVMGIKINPKDVISIPYDEGGKGRCLKYEVVFELGDKTTEFNKQGHPLIEGRQVVHITEDRKTLLAQILAHPTIVKKIKDKTLKESSIKKATYGRLQRVMQNLSESKPLGPLFTNTLRPAREAAGLTIEQLAKHLDITSGTVRRLEKDDDPNQKATDSYLKAVEELRKQKGHQHAVSYPTPVMALVN